MTETREIVFHFFGTENIIYSYSGSIYCKYETIVYCNISAAGAGRLTSGELHRSFLEGPKNKQILNFQRKN